MHALDALGNPVRRDILRHLRVAPCSVGELAERFPVSRPAISRHLRVLREAGLVQTQADGTRNVYTLHREGFDSARAFLDEFWDEALSRLEALAYQEAGAYEEAGLERPDGRVAPSGAPGQVPSDAAQEPSHDLSDRPPPLEP